MTDAVAALRAFNRFHTRHVGALTGSYLDSGMTLVEARILYEIGAGDGVLASTIQAELGLDMGYLSRIVARFETRGWIVRVREAGDARRRPIRLTETGREMFAQLDRRSDEVVEKGLAGLGEDGRRRLVAALDMGSSRVDLQACKLEYSIVSPK